MNVHAVFECVLWLLGLCVGSFLNVVIYRLPRELSIRQPRWSFCPACGTTLRWYDNIPLASWLLLRGRCRACQAPISVRYPLVEALTGLAFVLVYHLLVVQQARWALTDATPARDWPVLAAWLVLVSALIASSAMDLVSYMIDTRVTNFVVYAAIVLYALWPGLQPSAAASSADAAALVAVIVGALWWWRSLRHEHEHALPASEVPPAEPPTADRTDARPLAALVGMLTLTALAAVFVLGDALDGPGIKGLESLAVPAAIVLLLIVMVLSGSEPREADHEVHAAIEAERPAARRTALGEVVWLLPVVIPALAVGAVVHYVPAAERAWESAVAWRVAGRYPLAGATLAAWGCVVGAACGWTVRIVFTLAFGREAFGIGDIFILAAAGAAAGAEIALLGFLFAVPIALIGWLASLVLKRTMMIPFGPPLALGFVVALWQSRPAAAVARNYLNVARDAWQQKPQLVLLFAGLMVVCAVVAVLIARLIRAWVEPQRAGT